jgi:hypothetical protein
MVGLKPAHRRVLVAHLPELANIAIGSFLFGQFLSNRPYSVVLAIVGIAAWFALIGLTFLVANVDRFWFSVVLLGGIISIVSVIVGLDWLARRKDRRTRNRAA